MEAHHLWYVAGWGTACTVALAIGVVRRRRLPALLPYARFLLPPWKLVTYAIATLIFVLAAPLSGDPTWDAGNSLLVGSLTFLTAPWAIGILFRVLSRKSSLVEGFVALCVALASACWSYDLYILLRDRIYPPTWAANIPLSLTLYVAAGLFWSLEHDPDSGTRFAFTRPTWPEPLSGSRFLRLLPIAALFMAFVAFVVGLFVWARLRG